MASARKKPEAESFQISNPPPGAIYLIDPTLRSSFQELPLRAQSPDGGSVRWLVDGKVYETQTEWWSASRRRRRGDASTPRGDASRPADKPDRNPWPAPFDEPFHLLLNVAVGGNFVGSPDADTPFPAEMVVDYVRVYDRRSGDDGTTPKRR